MECKNKRYVADPFIAAAVVNNPAETTGTWRKEICSNIGRSKNGIYG